MTLEEMHERRADYAASVRQLAAESLAANGLELESVAIVDLDQTSLEFFDPSNAFDAEGLTQLTETIETRRRMRNEIEQRTLVDIRNQNLDTQRKVLEIDRETEYARLEQEREVEIRRAAQQRAELVRERPCATRKPSRHSSRRAKRWRSRGWRRSARSPRSASTTRRRRNVARSPGAVRWTRRR